MTHRKIVNVCNTTNHFHIACLKFSSKFIDPLAYLNGNAPHADVRSIDIDDQINEK